MRKTLAFATLMLLSACGFQLQGRQVLPERLSTLQLQLTERHSDFSKALNRALGASGATLVPQVAEGGTVVRVLHDAVSERVLSVDARNIPTDIELIYEVEIEVRAGTEELMAPEPFALSRIFSFDERKQLAKEREKDLLREALARDMASVVMRRLASL